ncbi:MAG: NAD(P)-binding domain-containing protein, partial [Planctomycetota bacterium]
MFLGQDRSEDVVIVGAGPIGIACAIAALKRGMDPLLIDAGAVVNSIVHYPIGMTFFTTPERLEIGGHPFPCAAQKPTREESIRYYRGVVRNEQIRVSTYTRLLAATRHKSFLECKVANSGGELRLRCQRVILASGYFDHPNLMEIPGEDLPHVRHYFDEAHRSYDQDVVVIGGR